MTDRMVALAFLAFLLGFLIGDTGREDGPPPDYRNQTIDALQAQVDQLEGEIGEWEEHHEAVHRGECVPRPDWRIEP